MDEKCMPKKWQGQAEPYSFTSHKYLILSDLVIFRNLLSVSE